MSKPRLPAGAPTILVAAATMLSIAMGLRQSLGLFMLPAVRELSIAVADFTLAIAIQNLAWGFLQPVAGAVATRHGFRPVLLFGVLCNLAGLAVMAMAQGRFGLIAGAGLLVGTALACCASAMANAVVSRPVPAALRSTVLGMVSAGGSLGALLAAPLGQMLSDGFGWRAGVWGFVALGLAMLPAAWLAGRVDRVALPPASHAAERAASAGAAAGLALRHPPFVIMSLAYFICGLQLVFLTTHLPSYLALCGMEPMLGAQALGTIGAFNILGSLFFGWAGGRWNKGVLLGGLYLARSLVLAWYFMTPPSPASTLVFAALMGFLWLGVSPLVSGLVAEMFGLRWQAMIQGIAFSSHQLGSFLGAYGGGVMFDLMGNYDMAVRFGIGLGLLAGTVQVLAALPRWPGPRARAAAG